MFGTKLSDKFTKHKQEDTKQIFEYSLLRKVLSLDGMLLQLFYNRRGGGGGEGGGSCSGSGKCGVCPTATDHRLQHGQPTTLADIISVHFQHVLSSRFGITEH